KIWPRSPRPRDHETVAPAARLPRAPTVPLVGAFAGLRFVSSGPGALVCARFDALSVVIEHEEPHSRRKITVLALRIDRANEARQGCTVSEGDLPQGCPEVIL